MNGNNNETIDIESDLILDLANQYQNINSDIAAMSAGCSKPSIPSFFDVGDSIDGLMTTVQNAENELSNKMQQISQILNNAVNTLKENDELNMLDFFSEEDINYLLSGTKIVNGEVVALSFEERCKRMDDMADMLYNQLNEMKAAYKEMYGNGIPYDAKKAYKMVKLFDALGIFIETDSNKISISVKDDFYTYRPFEGDDNVYLGKNTLLDIFAWCEENNVIPVIKDYLNGKSWESSGMEELFGANLRKIDVEMYDYHFADMADDEELDLSDAEYAEYIFTYRYLNETFGMANGHNDRLLTEDFTNYINQNFSSYDDIFDRNQTELLVYPGTRLKYYHIKDMDKAKSCLKQFLLDSNLFQTYDDLYVEALACDQLENDIAIYSQTAYDYRFNGRAMAYEADKYNPKYNYNEYLLRDYNKGENMVGMPIEYGYLSQGEMALYMMYLENNEKSKANDYLKSLSDRITSRKAMEKVENTISNWNKNGGDVLDYIDCGISGLGNGLTNYLDGIGALFGDGRRQESDYINMYMLSLLSSDNKYNNNLSPAFRGILKNNYEVMSSVGHSAIPVALSFVPGGRAVGFGLSTLSTAGSRYKYARQTGASGEQSYEYSILSGLSDTAMMYLLSGIAGVNGSDAALKSFSGWAMGSVRSFGSAALGTYVDAGIKSWTLGESFDFDEVSEQALHNAWIAAQSTGVTNATIAGIKAAPSVLQKVKTRLSHIFRAQLTLLGIADAVPSGSGTTGRIIITRGKETFDLTEHEEGKIIKTSSTNSKITGTHLTPATLSELTIDSSGKTTTTTVSSVESGKTYQYWNKNNYLVTIDVQGVDSSGVFKADVIMVKYNSSGAIVEQASATNKTFWPVGTTYNDVARYAQYAYRKTNNTNPTANVTYNGITAHMETNNGYPKSIYPIFGGH